jgi:hypothetical protein
VAGVRAREAIQIALHHPAAPAVAAALAVSLDTSGSSHDLLKVFADAGIDSTIRWHIVDRLAQRADGPALLRDAWAQRDLDAYGRELIIDALARYDARASASFWCNSRVMPIFPPWCANGRWQRLKG